MKIPRKVPEVSPTERPFTRVATDGSRTDLAVLRTSRRAEWTAVAVRFNEESPAAHGLGLGDTVVAVLTTIAPLALAGG